LPEGTEGVMEVELGTHETSTVKAKAVRRVESGGKVFYGFLVESPDESWRRCVAALHGGRTQAELAEAVPISPPAGMKPQLQPERLLESA
jgi:hypothetical protein